VVLHAHDDGAIESSFGLTMATSVDPMAYAAGDLRNDPMAHSPVALV
jgi:hypothetical protein